MLFRSLGQNNFAISFVATPLDAGGPGLLPAPSVQEQIEQTFRVAGLATRVSDRLTLLQSVLTQLNEAGGTIPGDLARDWRKRAEGQIREEQDIDRKYASFSSRYAGWARAAARKARIRIVERMINDVTKEDARLGGRRPEVVEALTAALRAELDNARRLQLLRDQWSLRKQAYREYQKSVGRSEEHTSELQSH